MWIADSAVLALAALDRLPGLTQHFGQQGCLWIG
jgi:hypothetical protein